MNKLWFSFLFLSCMSLCAHSAFGAETAPAGAEYSYGTVKSVSGNEVTVTEYDYDKDEDTEVVYDLGTAKLENVNSVSDIETNDTIDLMFKTENGKRVAVNASVEKEVRDVGLDSPEEPVEPEPAAGQ